MSRFSLSGLGGLLCALLCACLGHTVRNPTPYNVYLSSPTQADERYVIQAGDQLEVRFFYAPEQNVILPVRPDGYISLPLVNDVRAAGRTADDLRADITEACARTMKTPEVTVIVRSFTGYKVHVGGEVAKPGIIDLAGPRNVLQAIFEAGGFLTAASPSDVIVIRPEGPGNFAVIPIDIQAVLEGRDTAQNIALRPYDVIFVPSSPIANVNKWVEQYIRLNLPFNVSFQI